MDNEKPSNVIPISRPLISAMKALLSSLKDKQ